MIQLSKLDPDEKQMAHYNALDAVNTLMIAEHLHPAVIADDAYATMYDDTINLYPVFMYMMSRGILVNKEVLAESKIQIEKKMEEILKQLHERCDEPLNPNSPKQVMAYFYIKKGVHPYTKKTSPNAEPKWTVDDRALQRIARGTSTRKGLYEASLIQQYRSLSKLKGTYLDIEFDQDKRFRYQLKPRGTRFSRASSTKTLFGTGTNLQNLPDEFKAFLVSDPGYILVEIDKRQAEWVVMAYIAAEENMIRVIEANEDPHAHTAQQILASMSIEVPMDVIQQENKLVGHSNNPDFVQEVRDTIEFFRHYGNNWAPRTMSFRQMGKKSNHGLNYKETYKMFALNNELLEQEAKIIIGGYHRVYPGIEQYYETVKDQLLQDRTLYDLFSRKYRFLGRFDDSMWKSAISFVPQSTVGQLINRGLTRIYNDRDESLTDVDLLGQVHDSILFQFPTHRQRDLSRALYTIRAHLEPEFEAHGTKFTIKSDIKIGYNWRDMIEIDFGVNEKELAERLESGVRDLEQQET